jgi:hypothetical protein
LQGDSDESKAEDLSGLWLDGFVPAMYVFLRYARGDVVICAPGRAGTYYKSVIQRRPPMQQFSGSYSSVQHFLRTADWNTFKQVPLRFKVLFVQSKTSVHNPLPRISRRLVSQLESEISRSFNADCMGGPLFRFITTAFKSPKCRPGLFISLRIFEGRIFDGIIVRLAAILLSFFHQLEVLQLADS